MKITYDKEADAVYFQLHDGKFYSNKKIDDSTILDLDNEGNILGIEILDASKRIPKKSLSEVHIENIKAIA